MAVATPLILGIDGAADDAGPPQPGDAFRCSAATVVRAAYRDNPAHREHTKVAVRKVRRLASEIGIVGPVSKRLWKAFGIWADD